MISDQCRPVPAGSADAPD